MFLSFLLHIAVIVLVVVLSPKAIDALRPTARERPTNRILLQPVPAPSKGGGGSQTPRPPSRGHLPRFARKQYTPPVVTPVNVTPKLAIEPTIVIRTQTELAILPEASIGLPNGLPGPPSGGPGQQGGIGGGTKGGIGDGEGAGMQGRIVERLRVGVKAPVVIFKDEPEYSEQARKARVQGTIVVEGVIDERGLTDTLRVRDGLGFGLDEKAVEAVKHWRFRPATKDGKPVPIVGTFHINFRLL